MPHEHTETTLTQETSAADCQNAEQHGHHDHHHDHHEHVHSHTLPAKDSQQTVLTIRMHSGLSGDMFLAGLLCLTGLPQEDLDQRLAGLMPELAGSVHLVRKEVHNIGGWHAQVDLPHQHSHRTLTDMEQIIGQSSMQPRARECALATFTLLARAEGTVHGKKPEEVHFHEVGALDSILDICLTCELMTQLNPARIIASPLPLADGSVACAHGIIPVPAPAVLELLDNIPVKPFPEEGETVTPTAIALLRCLGAEFGPWPAMCIEKKALVYGTRVFDNAPNGTVFAYGRQL